MAQIKSQRPGANPSEDSAFQVIHSGVFQVKAAQSPMSGIEHHRDCILETGQRGAGRGLSSKIYKEGVFEKQDSFTSEADIVCIETIFSQNGL